MVITVVQDTVFKKEPNQSREQKQFFNIITPEKLMINQIYLDQ